jgi:outer membrane protein assembly factor BamA
MQAAVEHAVIPNPIGEGNVQEFHIEGAAPQIATVEFSDPAVLASKAIQQHLSEIRGKSYSRMVIDLFLTESIRPVYLQQGYLRVKLGPPEVRLAGNPNQKFPENIPVYVPVVPGAVFRWKQVRWAGNSVLSEFTLSGLLGAKSGDVANGIQMEEGWDRIREEYGHHGYLEAKLDPVATYDDQAHTVSYAVSVQEGIQYNFGKIVLTGLSLAAERKFYAVWPIASSNLFDKTKFEELLIKLQSHREQVFGELPVHYETVGHFLQMDPDKRTVDVLLDFK